MSVLFKSVGDTMRITGLASNYKAGALYSVGNGSQGPGYNFWGLFENDVIGTSSALTTVDGRPIFDNDLTGLSIHGVNVGDGVGELRVSGVHELVIGSGIADGGLVKRGVPLYASGVNTLAGVELRRAGALTPTSYGFVFPDSAYTLSGKPGGLSLVGHAWSDPFLDLRTSSPLKGGWVVETRLIGFPTANLTN